jgi:hypothetical protein
MNTERYLASLNITKTYVISLGIDGDQYLAYIYNVSVDELHLACFSFWGDQRHLQGIRLSKDDAEEFCRRANFFNTKDISELIVGILGTGI